MPPTSEHPPPAPIPAPLVPHVDAMYGYSAEGLDPGVHRGLPSDRLTLVFSLDQPLRTAPSAEEWDQGVRDARWVTLGGLHTRPAIVEQPGQWSGIQLSLNALGLHALMGAPAADLPVGTWDARDLLGPEVDRAVEELHEATDWDARYAVVTAMLLRRASEVRRSTRAREPGGGVRHAWELLTTRLDLTVGDVAEEVGYGRRRLAQLITAEVGHPPKMLQRLARFDAARRLVSQVPVSGMSLAAVAARTGYCDQSHLVRDFHEFAGLAPTAWLAEELPNIQASPPPVSAGSTS